jgi:hypothetical protein
MPNVLSNADAPSIFFDPNSKQFFCQATDGTSVPLVTKSVEEFRSLENRCVFMLDHLLVCNRRREGACCNECDGIVAYVANYKRKVILEA